MRWSVHGQYGMARAEVLKAVPDATVEVIDLHRSGDHFHVPNHKSIIRRHAPTSTTKASLESHETIHPTPSARHRFEVHDT